ncbi:MAG: SDR family NAD(P)-dependent oxidoreductase [Actinomycetota bacterium]|nr:SDR family NAD(P)-dependent oxidoreductase [Actinomycetota bacterium]
MATGRGVAVITGSSSGFGMLSAVELAGKGFRVYATMRNPGKRDNLDRAAAEAGVSVEVLPLDVTSDESVAAAFEKVLAEAGLVDVLVSNAGYGVGGFVEDTSIEQFREQFETNFFGGVRVVKAVLPGMRERRSGRIILMSSIGVFNSVPGLSAYNASKAALEAFGEALRYEAAHDGIFVTLIEPGTYATDIFFDNAKYAEGMQDPSSPHYERSRRLERFAMKQVERRRKADPREVARKVAQAATVRRPKLRYLVGTDARLIKPVRAVMPVRVTEAAVRKILEG